MAEIFKNEIIIFECCTGRKYPPKFFPGNAKQTKNVLPSEIILYFAAENRFISESSEHLGKSKSRRNNLTHLPEITLPQKLEIISSNAIVKWFQRKFTTNQIRA